MKTKKLTPRNAAPVQRENNATVARDGNAIAPSYDYSYRYYRDHNPESYATKEDYNLAMAYYYF